MNSMEILAAEDDELSGELLERILHPILTRFDIVKTLAGAMTLAAEHNYDLIILDLRLTDSEIEASIRAIQALKRAGNAPLIVVTGMPDPTLRQKCLDAGADGFIPKQEAYSTSSHALYIAVYAATIHHPGERSVGFMDKVRILEQLVHAA